MEYCVYYDRRTDQILDFLPQPFDNSFKAKITDLWSQEIPRKILKLLADKDSLTIPRIKAEIGHSMSTLHENIRKLEGAGLIRTEMIYTRNKQKVIKPAVLFVTKNPKFKESIVSFVNKGLWVNSKKTRRIIAFLDQHPDKYFSVEELSTRLKMPVDEIQVLLDNWDSQVTRAFTDFLKERPFEKRVLYRSKQSSSAQHKG